MSGVDMDYETKVKEQNATILSAIDRAEELLEESAERRRVREDAWAKLPLFEPGSTHGAGEAVWGFRVRDGYRVSTSSEGSVRVGTKRAGDAVEGKVSAFVNWWPDGIAWCYWSDSRSAPCGKSLAECVLSYGVGGWIDKMRGLQAKVAYLDAGRSHKPGRCFILCMSTIADPQQSILIKGHESNDDVYRAYRSAVPPALNHTIGLRELANLKETPVPPPWWQWASQ